MVYVVWVTVSPLSWAVGWDTVAWVRVSALAWVKVPSIAVLLGLATVAWVRVSPLAGL